jgi:hypothetical protein
LEIEEVPVVEDPADLELTKSCLPERPLSGQPFTCIVTVASHGPGLPRTVTVTDSLTSVLGGRAGTHEEVDARCAGGSGRDA